MSFLSEEQVPAGGPRPTYGGLGKGTSRHCRPQQGWCAAGWEVASRCVGAGAGQWLGLGVGIPALLCANLGRLLTHACAGLYKDMTMA